MIFNVYAIRSATKNRVYRGYTQDINVRLKYHNSGYVKSTKKDRPWRLIALERVKDKNDARWLELSLKKSRGMRVKWIEKNYIKT